MQVIAQFATISSGTGDGSYPEPAATLVHALSLANLDIVGFGALRSVASVLCLLSLIAYRLLFAVPLGCVFRGASFYGKVLLKSTAPLGVLVLLACYPLTYVLRGLPSEAATMTVKGLAMLFLELTLPNITTSLVQMFVCQQFDDGAFLSEMLTIPCNDSQRRALWVAFASVALVAYALGVPLLFVKLMFQHRHAIQKLGIDLQQHNQLRDTGLTISQYAKSKRARTSFTTLSLEMQWLMPKFEQFRPTAWYFGIVLLLFRLMQTSFLALVPTQRVQSAIMCAITLASILVQSELAPYRRSSDNQVALLAQVLVFFWVSHLSLLL